MHSQPTLKLIEGEPIGPRMGVRTRFGTVYVTLIDVDGIPFTRVEGMFGSDEFPGQLGLDEAAREYIPQA